MKISWIKLILLIFLSVLLLASCHPVEPGKYPWIVSVQRVTHFCAGSILEKKLVLTAASCIKGKKAKSLKIRAGSLLHESEGQLIELDDAIVHPEYDEESHVNDIALLVLKKDIEYGLNAQPVVLAKYDMNDMHATIVGGWQKWGGSKTMSDLRYAKITVFTPGECEVKVGNKFLKEKMLCAGIEKVGKGMCKGDVGGPLIIDGVQYGVVSWGSGCEPPNKPGVYTDIAFVKNWIRETAAKKNMPLPTEEPPSTEEPLTTVTEGPACKDFECDR